MPDRTRPCERGSGVEALARLGASIWINRGVCIADARRHLADAERDMRCADQERQLAQRTLDRQKQLSHITGASDSLGVALRAMRNAAASARKQAAAKVEAAGAIKRASNSGSDVVNDILAAARRCRPSIRSPSWKNGGRARSPERFPGGSLIARNSPHWLPAGQGEFPDRRENFPARQFRELLLQLFDLPEPALGDRPAVAGRRRNSLYRGVPGNFAAAGSVENEDGAVIVDVGQSGTGHDEIAENGEKSVGIVIGERVPG
jgi:hypothetical protein